MNTSRAICTLETMAIDMVGTLGGLNKANPIAPVLERQIEAINMAQDALRAVRDFATDTNVGHIDADRMSEIMQAEREGRLVILPCKNGGTVYVAGESRVVECYIMETYLADDGSTEHHVSFECDNDCEGCPFNSWHQDYSGEYSCDGEWGHGVIKGNEVGKTVFLTREAAEKALEEAK